MTRTKISKYFKSTEHRQIREDLVFAAQNVGEPKVAIDCGCGSGADINYLVSKGFFVYGFDIEVEAISRCKTRFKNYDNVVLSNASFSSYTYPTASLVVADASLFFCSQSEFIEVWNNISQCLSTNGIFCGSFLGTEDTMASPDYNSNDYWSEISVFEEEELRALFQSYEILKFSTHKSSGETVQGDWHDWHIYSVVAKKTSQ